MYLDYTVAAAHRSLSLIFLSVCLSVSVCIHASPLLLGFSGTKLDTNARAAIKNALLLLRGKEARLAKAGEARERRRRVRLLTTVLREVSCPTGNDKVYQQSIHSAAPV